ncbi:hypothetical protein EV421DRAFT_1902467 [Armillaria borealis]|uniref:NAD-dependent epimerase/dehydratase domain-containing protein n=1 Tax=Armillaria borealis TaxID=47425 RepID=A0AA39MTS1_9AGAR|nr:hypothetical protein EV421DRAFT_1902467 [Armillaria borealis]
MTDSSQKPSVLIFGGLNTYSRALAAYLVPLEGDPLVSHVRMVDKYQVAPATTYIGAEFPKILEKEEVDYQQANLTVPSNIPPLFDPPEGQPPYDYVFDLTGEVRQDRTDMIQISTTCNVARILGEEAAKRKVKAYCPWDEKQNPKPSGTVGTWWHETLRILANMEDLNLVILRAALGYGPYTDYGTMASFITVAAVYGYMNKPMKSLWSPGKHPSHTVHVEDIAGGLWACAQWMAPLASSRMSLEAPAPDKKVTAPLFNLADDSQMTLAETGQLCTSFFGTTFDFFNFFENTIFKLKDDIVEEINELHVGHWTEMILKSNPPIPNTPLSAYMDKYYLEKTVVGFSNSKIKTVTGYQLSKPRFNHDTIKDMIDKWKAEGSWPIL